MAHGLVVLMDVEAVFKLGDRNLVEIRYEFFSGATAWLRSS